MINRWADQPESNHLQLFLFTVSQRHKQRWRHTRHFDFGYLSNQTSSEWLTTIITSQTFPWLIKLVAIRSNILSTNTDKQIIFGMPRASVLFWSHSTCSAFFSVQVLMKFGRRATLSNWQLPRQYPWQRSSHRPCVSGNLIHNAYVPVWSTFGLWPD